MFQRFYPTEPDHVARTFAERVLKTVPCISAAQVQGFFMFYKDSAENIMQNIEKIATS